jgi:hypothetical protein
MAGLLIVPGIWPVIDANGTPVSGATINFYEPNTVTPKAVYSDDTLATSLGTSLTTNAGGEPTTLAGTVARLWWAADAGVYDVEVIAGASTRTWSGVAVSDSAVMSRLVYDADYATLALAVSDAISRGQSLYITQDHTISTNTTIACPVIVDGGSFSVNEFRTLTFTRGLDAGWEQIFLGLGLVTGLRDVAAEWWGAKSDDTGDASIGWNKANACRMSAALSGTTVGEWRHRLNERGTYRFMSTAELHVSATAGLTMRGGGPIFQTILKAGSGSSGTILLKITAPLSGLDKIVTFDIGGFSVVEEVGTSMICGLQVGDTVTGSYGDKTYALRGVTYSTISNVQSNGFTNGFKNVNASFIEYNNCTAWNQTSEAFIGFWDYCDRPGAVGFINYNNCYVAGNFGDVTRIGHLTDSTSGGYATRIIGTVVMEDSGYQRFMKYAEGGALANIEVGVASELDGDLDPLTSARGVFVQCEDLLAYAGPASACRNIIINGIWVAGHNDAAVTFKTVKAGSMRDIKILNSAIANHTGNAILIDGPIDGVIISNVTFQECSSAGPLVWLTNGVTKAIIDNVTLTQPTPALTVLSMVQIDSTCNNVSVGNIIANEANCTAGLIVDNTPNTARKSIVSLTKGALVKPTGTSVYSYDADWKARILDIRDFGAVEGGVVDASTAINAAINVAEAAGHGTVFIPDGDWLVNSEINWTADRVNVKGASVGGTRILKTSTTGNLFNCTGSFCNISDLSVVCTGTHTSGTLFLMNGGGHYYLSNLFTSGGYDIALFNGAQCYLNQCTLNDFKNDGIATTATFGGQFHAAQVRMGLPGDNTNQGRGFYPRAGDTYTLSGVDITSAKYPFFIAPPAGITLVNLFFVNCLGDQVGRTDSVGDAWLFDGSAAASILRRIFLTNCWAGVAQRDGYRLIGVGGCFLSNCIGIASKQRGFYTIGSPTPNEVQVIGGIFCASSFGSSGTYPNIEIGNFTTSIRLIGVRAGPEDSIVETASYGIKIGTNVDDITVDGCNVEGNVTGGISDNTASTDNVRVINCPGHNPVGSSTPTPSGSPYNVPTHHEPTTVYISGGTVSAIVLQGGTTAFGATPATVHRGPNESLQIVYTVAPTVVVYRH